MANALDQLVELKKKWDPIGYATTDELLGIKKSENVQVPNAPLPPAIDPNAQMQRDAKALEDRRRRVLASKAMTNPTGSLGVTGNSGAVAKQLLGA